jgi:hypothetical protein
MYKLIDKTLYDKLMAVAQITAQQLYFNQDYLDLAKATSICKLNKQFVSNDADDALFAIECNLTNFMLNSAMLVGILKDINILKDDQEVKSNDDTEPTPPKPTFKVVK